MSLKIYLLKRMQTFTIVAIFLGIYLGIGYCPSILHAQNTGKLAGYVKDANTQEPLIGVTIRLENTDLGGVTDIDGYYLISDIPAKTYNVVASYVGFKTSVQYDVIISSGNTQSVTFYLQEAVTELDGVEVIANNSPTSIESPTSIQKLSAQEIKTYPGGNNDIAKVVQSLPGVSGSVGFRNDVIIRGGAPNENVYYLDGIEIPNINHFATQGSAGGPVGMLNVNFIEDVTLSTSAFHARYDNPLSGVLQFSQRVGNKDQRRYGFRLGASEFAATTEGAFSKKNPKITYILSVRRSYLQLLFQAIDLPFLPAYWDYQYKFNFKIDNKNEISLLGIGSIDQFEYNPPDSADATLEQLAILDDIPIYTQRTNTWGINWKHQLTDGFMNLALSNNILDNQADKFDDNDEGNEDKRRFKYRSQENETKLRWDINKFKNNWKYSFGANVQYSVYSNETLQRIRGAEFDETKNLVTPAFYADYETDITFWKYGLFGQISATFLDEKLSLSAGIRTDMNTFMNEGNNLLETLSPRLSISYELLQDFNINLSIGRYYKIPPYTILGFQNNEGELVNKNTKYIKSIHYVAGFEWLPTKSTRITLEGFYKKYDTYPVSVMDSVSLANLGGDFDVLGNEEIKSIGLGETYGLEFLFQQRLTKNFYGILAYTYYFSEYTGFDKNTYIASTWDNRHLVSFTGGYKLPRNWEIGIRSRYLGAAPFTPYNIDSSIKNYVALGRGILDYSNLNTERLSDFWATDIRIDKKWNFKKWALNLFLDVQNVFGNINKTPPTFTLQRNENNNFEGANGEVFNGQNGIPVLLSNDSSTTLPTIGLNIEF